MKKGAFDPVDLKDSELRERRFENLMERWLAQKEEEEKTNELSRATLKCYKSYDRTHFHFFNGRDVRDIGFEQLEDFKDQLPNGLSLKMKRNILNALHAFFMWGRRKGKVKEMPVWPEIKGDDARVSIAIDLAEQLEALGRIPEGHRDVITFLMEEGLRIGEVCAIKVRDFDLKNSWKESRALIQRTWSEGKLVETTKGKNKRWIPLSEVAYDIAVKHTRGRWPEDFAFINPQTKREYRQEFLRRVWRRYAGIDVTLYEGSRHSFCTQIVEDGAKLEEAKLLMRHADIRSTERYFHGNVTKYQEIVNQRGRVRLLREAEREVDQK
jgi:integrase